MKKSIILIFTLVVALFLSAIQVSGQIPGGTTGSAPSPISCVGSPYNPIAGNPYDYSATLNPALGSAYWYATDNVINPTLQFMVGGVRPGGIEEPNGGPVVALATNYMDNVTGDASPTTTQITWTAAGLAAHTPPAPTDPPSLFVVVEYTAPATGCANNVKVYPIRPINAFVVDIQSWTPGPAPAPGPAGYGTLVEQCYSGVQSAVYNPLPAPEGGIDYDFGINVMYFEVVAANFTGGFTPSFQLSAMQAGQTADIDVGTTFGTWTNNLATGITGGAGIITCPEVTTALTNTSGGVSLYVRLTIHNNNWEGVANATDAITLAVDAQTGTPAVDDVNNLTCAVNTPFQDLIAQNLKKRPTVTQVAPNVFLPVN